VKYATFGNRLAALLIDVVILSPLVAIDVLLEGQSKVFAYVVGIPLGFSYCAYSIYCHGRFGKTIGKHLSGIRVVQVSGERLAWRQACLRSSVDVLLALVTVIARIIALRAISDTGGIGLS